jgi:ABC-type spermidine/putrescine transport system permease subunit II
VGNLTTSLCKIFLPPINRFGLGTRSGPWQVPIILTAVGITFVYAKVGLIATISGLVLANVMLGSPYVTTQRMFTALRDDIDPTIAAISTPMTATSFMPVLIASTRKRKST